MEVACISVPFTTNDFTTMGATLIVGGINFRRSVLATLNDEQAKAPPVIVSVPADRIPHLTELGVPVVVKNPQDTPLRMAADAATTAVTNPPVCVVAEPTNPFEITPLAATVVHVTTPPATIVPTPAAPHEMLPVAASVPVPTVVAATDEHVTTPPVMTVPATAAPHEMFLVAANVLVPTVVAATNVHVMASVTIPVPFVEVPHVTIPEAPRVVAPTVVAETELHLIAPPSIPVPVANVPHCMFVTAVSEVVPTDVAATDVHVTAPPTNPVPVPTPPHVMDLDAESVEVRTDTVPTDAHVTAPPWIPVPEPTWPDVIVFTAETEPSATPLAAATESHVTTPAGPGPAVMPFVAVKVVAPKVVQLTLFTDSALQVTPPVSDVALNVLHTRSALAGGIVEVENAAMGTPPLAPVLMFKPTTLLSVTFWVVSETLVTKSNTGTSPGLVISSMYTSHRLFEKNEFSP